MPLSLPKATDGDTGFTGFSSRLNPAALPAGTLAYSQNMRLDRGVATTRKGTKRMVSSFQLAQQIYAVGSFSLPGDGVDKILLAGDTRLYQWNTKTKELTSLQYPTGRYLERGDKAYIFQAYDRAYILRGESQSAMRQVTSITVTSGRATVALAGHGFANGAEVTIFGADQPDYNGSHTITTYDPDKFSFAIGSTTSPATGTIYAVRCKPALMFDGSQVTVVSHAKGFGSSDSSFPPADFGIYTGNRLVLRQGRDKICISDYLDADTFDMTLGIFQLNLGENDEIIGFTPWDNNKLIIFKRRAVYIAYLENNYDGAGQSDLGGGSYVQSVTDQVGCAARQTIANAGQAVFFLSDSGVRVLDPQLDLKLLGNSMPLSDPISDIIERINVAAIQGAVGKIHNNRYYLAVPLDGSTYNNAVLVYNILNQAWESIDIYPDGVRFDGLLVANYTRPADECNELDPALGCMRVEVDLLVR